MDQRLHTTSSRRDQRGSRTRGFSLLGVVIALMVTVMVGVAITNLAARTMAASRASNERFIATALAREGIELARWLRDANYLSATRGAAAIPWRLGVCDGTWIIDPALSALTAPGGSFPNGELFLKGGSPPGYRHDAAGVPTRYRRLVYITTTDGDDADSVVGNDCTLMVPTNDPATEMPDPVTVRSVVEWGPSGGPFQSLQLVEQLYHWMRRKQ